ncbi:FBP domain-containing protein [Streptomyces sp. NPDC020571]|uniref:FBP domain-containing protein n=1 Tax=Streptomyces sp. NPDC020571 TaxID=3365079 RepID=UPI003797148D
MRPLTERDIRTSFVNCSKGVAERLPLPEDLADIDHWSDLYFLGWRDLSAPARSYLVTERGGEPVGVTLLSSSTTRGFLRRSMCSLCLTPHPGGRMEESLTVEQQIDRARANLWAFLYRLLS